MESSYLLGIFLGALQAMVPITLAATGEIIGESAGLFNIGLEGIILTSALTGALGAEMGGPAAGLMVGLATGVGFGLIFGLISTYLKGTQLIVGVGINLFAGGLVPFWLIQLGVPGHHSIPRVYQVPGISIPGGSLSPLVLVAIVLPGLAYLVLFKTKLGLKIKACGENPQAADVSGINVWLVRLLSTTAGAGLAGLAGAYMSVDWMGSVTKEIAAGRGFIALATVVFSGLNPLIALVGGFIFGFFDNLSVWVSTMPAIQKIIPWQFVAMLPYVITIAVVAIFIGRARFPEAMGEPYLRE